MDWSLLWDIAGPFVGGMIALIGVLIAQRNAARMSDKQLASNERLKQMELAAERRSAVRRDRKDAYVTLLKAWEGSLRYVEKLGEQGIHSTQLKHLVENLTEQLPKTDEATTEVNAYGSTEVIEMAHSLHEAFRACLDAYDLGPKHLEANERVQRAIEHHHFRDLYEALLNQIRMEIGVLNSIDLKPTPEEVRALAKKLLEGSREIESTEGPSNTP